MLTPRPRRIRTRRDGKREGVGDSRDREEERRRGEAAVSCKNSEVGDDALPGRKAVVKHTLRLPVAPWALHHRASLLLARRRGSKSPAACEGRCLSCISSRRSA